MNEIFCIHVSFLAVSVQMREHFKDFRGRLILTFTYFFCITVLAGRNILWMFQFSSSNYLEGVSKILEQIGGFYKGVKLAQGCCFINGATPPSKGKRTFLGEKNSWNLTLLSHSAPACTGGWSCWWPRSWNWQVIYWTRDNNEN